MAHWHTLWPGQIIEIDHDTLRHDPEAICRKLLTALELKWDDAMFRPCADIAPKAGGATPGDYGEALHPGSLFKQTGQLFQSHREPEPSELA